MTTYGEVQDLEQNAVTCPNCGSHNILINHTDELVCDDCQESFSLLDSPEGVEATAMLYYEQAQKEFALNPAAYRYIREDLQKARKLLESNLKKNRSASLFMELGMVYLSLGDTYLINFEQRESTQGLDAFRKALRYIRQSRKAVEMENDPEHSVYQLWFLEGLVHDKMAVALNDFGQKESVITQIKKTIRCFESALEGKEELSESNRMISAKFLARNYWMLMMHLFEKNQEQKALIIVQKLLAILQSIRPKDEIDRRALRAGLGLAHETLADLLKRAPLEKKKGSRNARLQRAREIEDHLRQSERIYDGMDKYEAQIDFEIWLGLIDPRDREGVLQMIHEEYPNAYPGPDSEDSIHEAHEGPLEWNSMTRKEQEEHARLMDEKINQLFAQMAAAVHSPEQAQSLAQRVLEMMHDLEKEGVIDQAQSCFYLYQAGHKFEKAGYKKAALTLWTHAIYYGTKELDQDLSPLQQADRDNFLAQLCYKASVLALGLKEENELIEALFSMSLHLLQNLEKQGRLANNELYGNVLLIQAQRLQAQGEIEEAEKTQKKALLYLNQPDR